MEIARRLPVWCALSDVFLDAELDEHCYRDIVEVIGANGFAGVEAEAILRTEVAPAFAYNLWSVAGEWAGWSEATVRELVLAISDRSFGTCINRLMLGKHIAAD